MERPADAGHPVARGLAPGWLFASTALGVALVTGCAQTDAVQPDPTWVEPAWMANARAKVEEHQTAMIACLAEHGFQGVPAMGSGVVVSGNVDPETGADTTGLADLQSAALESCSERIGWPEMWLAPPDDAAYQRMLDARECLVAHGVELPVAPSREVWLEQSPPWFPHNELDLVSDDEFRELVTACPQPGAQGLVVRVDADDLPTPATSGG